MYMIRSIFIAVCFMVICSSCSSETDVRVYEETVLNPSDEGVPMMPPGHPPLDSGAERGMPPGHPPIDSLMAGSMPSMGSMPSVPGVTADMSLQFTWKLPVDWVERDKGSMRLASFSSGSGEALVDCSIVALGGGAGGLDANVQRWMGQINLNFSSGKELNDFIAKSEKLKTADGLEGVVIDFTALQANAKGAAPSILALVFPYDGRNVFVKLSGPKSEILKNKSKFKEFCQSLKVARK